MSKGKHAFTGRFLHWFYCRKCGLVRLNNDTARRAARSPCDSDADD